MDSTLQPRQFLDRSGRLGVRRSFGRGRASCRDCARSGRSGGGGCGVPMGGRGAGRGARRARRSGAHRGSRWAGGRRRFVCRRVGQSRGTRGVRAGGAGTGAGQDWRARRAAGCRAGCARPGVRAAGTRRPGAEFGGCRGCADSAGDGGGAARECRPQRHAVVHERRGGQALVQRSRDVAAVSDDAGRAALQSLQPELRDRVRFPAGGDRRVLSVRLSVSARRARVPRARSAAGGCGARSQSGDAEVHQRADRGARDGFPAWPLDARVRVDQQPEAELHD